MNKKIFYLLLIVSLTSLLGCQEKEILQETEVKEDRIEQDLQIEKYKGDLIKLYDVIYTLEEVLSLTFDRILPKEELIPLLDELDIYDIKATFFASTEEVMTNPEAVEEIIARGHELESNPLSKTDISSLNYEDIYRLIIANKRQIEQIKKQDSKYIYIDGKKNEKKVRKIASQLDMAAVIHHSYQLRGLKTDDEAKLMDYMNRAVARGGIVSMDPEDYHAIPYLMKVVDEVEFNFIPLSDLIELDQERKPFKEIEGAQAIQKNLDFSNVQPFIHRKENTMNKEVALTFDDWASEAVVLEVLDILEEYEVLATFYLKTNIVRENPNLARLLIEAGHEVANHSHSHLDSTTLTPEELQKDLYKAHKIITEAIQEQPKLYFRPPFGKVDDQAALAIAAMGFEVIADYDVSSYDWNEEYSQEDVINRVMTKVQPGSVIVMHILNDIHTPAVLPSLIEQLKDEGYKFVLTSDWIEK